MILSHIIVSFLLHIPTGGVLATARWVISRILKCEGAGVVTEVVRSVWAEARVSATPAVEDCTSTQKRARVWRTAPLDTSVMRVRNRECVALSLCMCSFSHSFLLLLSDNCKSMQ